MRSLVHDHHERLEGSGYPRRLVESQISLEARILAVCDVYDALISPRCYRPAWDTEEAIQILRDGGVQFDERCVDALIRVLAGERQARPVAA